MTEEKQEQRSFIYIEFESSTSISVKDQTKWQVNNISPMQMWAVAEYLKMKGHQLMASMEMQQMRIMQEQQERTKIIVPKPNIKLEH